MSVTPIAPETDRHGPTTVPDAPADTNSGRALFDASDFDREDLAIPQVDGQSIDRIRVAFSGGVWLDRANPADVALYRTLRLGRLVDLRVEVRVTGKAAKGATNKDGDLDVVAGVANCAVTSLHIPISDPTDDEES